MRYEERPQFSSALTQAAFSLTPGRRIEKGATSIRSRQWESSVFSCCQSGSAIGVTELPPGRQREFEGGFSPRFPPTHLEDFHVKFILKTRPRSKPTVGGGSGGSRGTAAIEPAP